MCGCRRDSVRSTRRTSGRCRSSPRDRTTRHRARTAPSGRRCRTDTSARTRTARSWLPDPRGAPRRAPGGRWREDLTPNRARRRGKPGRRRRSGPSRRAAPHRRPTSPRSNLRGGSPAPHGCGHRRPCRAGSRRALARRAPRARGAGAGQTRTSLRPPRRRSAARGPSAHTVPPEPAPSLGLRAPVARHRAPSPPARTPPGLGACRPQGAALERAPAAPHARPAAECPRAGGRRRRYPA